MIKSSQKDDYDRLKSMKVDEIKQEITKLGGTALPRGTKDNLIKQYLQLKQEVRKIAYKPS